MIRRDRGNEFDIIDSPAPEMRLWRSGCIPAIGWVLVVAGVIAAFTYFG